MHALLDFAGQHFWALWWLVLLFILANGRALR